MDNVGILQKIINNIDKIVCMLDEHGAFLYASEKTTSILAGEPGGLEGRLFGEFIHDGDAAEFRQLLSMLSDSNDTEGTIEFRLRGRDGVWRWYLSTVTAERECGKLLLSQGSTVAEGPVYIVNAEDITDRKNEMKRFRLLASMHEITMEIMRYSALNDIIRKIVEKACQFYKAPGGFCLLLNEERTRVESICNIGICVALNQTFNPSEGLFAQVLRSGRELLLDDYSSWNGRLQLECCDKMKSVIGYPLKRISGEVIGVIGVARFDEENRFTEEDIDYMCDFAYLASMMLDNSRLQEKLRNELNEKKSIERMLRQNEEQIRQTQKMEALGTLAGGIAHDFNNILTGIVGYTELSIEDAPKESIMYQCMVEVLKLGVRAKDLVAQILAFSRKNANKNERLDMANVLKETVRMLRATLPTTISIKVSYAYSPAVIHADPTEIQQLILNLCINAEYAMKKNGGTIDITLERTDSVSEGYVHGSGTQTEGYAALSIKDTGCGMDKRTIDRIFEPFFTTKGVQEGTGLGLSVVHGIVTRHKGFITVDSKLNKGTVFKVYFPLSKKEKAEDLIKGS